MRTEKVIYSGGGLELHGYLVCDPAAGEPRPGVVVFPEAFGLNDHAREKADRLASEAGYVVFAADLHGGERVAGSLEEAMGLVGKLRQTPNRIVEVARAALDTLLARPETDNARVGAIGYCFGASMALELSRTGADLAGVVCFHGGLITKSDQDSRAIRGQVLACIGADDPHITADHRASFEAEMREAKVNWQMSIYGGARHSFTNREAEAFGQPEFAAYDPQADSRSWAEMRAFFCDVLGPQRKR